MEQYEYPEAVEAFRNIHSRAPGWIPGAINLAIALLNDSGVKAEKAKKAGGKPAASNFDEALALLAGILDRDPDNPYAHYCRGIILEQQGRSRGSTSALQTRDRASTPTMRPPGTGWAPR